jgi:hypothetical protein
MNQRPRNKNRARALADEIFGLSPCLICILVDSSEKSRRRGFAAPSLTEVGQRECHKNPDP